MSEKTYHCRDCGADFAFTEKEQTAFRDQGFADSPTRCLKCHRTDRQKTKFFKKAYRENRFLGG